MEGKTQTAGEAVRISVQLSLGGAAFGVAVGLAATLWLRFMFDNMHAEITLTVCHCPCCFLLPWLAVMGHKALFLT